MGSKTNKVSIFKSKVFIGCFVVVFVGAIIFLTIDASKKRTLINEWEDRIYPGVSISDVDLGGKTSDEAEKILKNEIASKLSEKRIMISVADKNYDYKYGDFSAEYDTEKALDEALSYGKDLDTTEKYELINSNEKHDLVIPINYDEKKVQEAEEKIITDSKVEPKNASLKINNGNIEIIPEVNGVTVDKDKIDGTIKDAFNNDEEYAQVDIECTTVEAKVKKEDLSKIKATPMGSFYTDYSSSSYERATNIEIAASLVNGIVLMPGEEFSYSETTQKGRGQYKDAPVYVNNEVQMAEAGGICQVSTTLYRAVMRANIRSVERHNHSLPVGYAQKGLDATVSWGSLDYKFKNTYDFPIYIEGITQNRTVTFNIYGNPDALDGKTYDMASDVEAIEPEVTYQDDPEMYEGETETVTEGSTGYKAISYQITYKDGKEINREVVAKDTYATKDTVIKRGTKPKEKVTTTPEKTKEENKNNNETNDNESDIKKE